MYLEFLNELIPEIEKRTYIRLEIYANELVKFNKAINLVSPSTIPKMGDIHFADSLLGAQIVRKSLNPSDPLYDLGSGNGFPGLAFAMLYPEIEIILVERDSRKCEFLKHIVDLTKLENVKVINNEIKALGNSAIKQAMARGLAPIPRALLHFRPLFPPSGKFYHFKSDSWAKEVADIPSQAFSVWECGLLETYHLPQQKSEQAIVLTTRIV